MRRPVFIARQSGHPRGLLGRLLLAITRRETATHNERALALLALQPGDALLDVGFGSGWMLEQAARRGDLALVAGVDISHTAVDSARHRLADLFRTGRVDIQLSDGHRLPFPDARFDAVQSVHTLYFWSDPLAQLAEIRRVMRPGARLCLGFRPAELADFAAEFPADVYRFYESPRVAELLHDAGFEAVDTHIDAAPGRMPMAFAVAQRPTTAS